MLPPCDGVGSSAASPWTSAFAQEHPEDPARVDAAEQMVVTTSPLSLPPDFLMAAS